MSLDEDDLTTFTGIFLWPANLEGKGNSLRLLLNFYKDAGGTELSISDIHIHELIMFLNWLWDSGEINLKDHDDFKWISLEQLAEFDFAPADLVFVEKLQNGEIREVSGNNEPVKFIKYCRRCDLACPVG